MFKQLSITSLCMLLSLSCGQGNDTNSKLNDVRGVSSKLDKVHVFFQDGDSIKYGLYTQGLAMPSRHADLENIRSIPKEHYFNMIELSIDHVEPLKAMALEEVEYTKNVTKVSNTKSKIELEISKLNDSLTDNQKDQETLEQKARFVQNAINGIDVALRAKTTPNEELSLLLERKANYLHTLTNLNKDLESKQRIHINLINEKLKIEIDELNPLKADLLQAEEALEQHRESMEEQRKELRSKIDSVTEFFDHEESLALYEGQKLYDILLVPFEHRSWGEKNELKIEKGKFSQKYDEYNRPSGKPYFFQKDYEITVKLGRTGTAYISWELENLWTENRIAYSSDFALEENSKVKVAKVQGQPYGKATYVIANKEGAETMVYYRVLN